MKRPSVDDIVHFISRLMFDFRLEKASKTFSGLADYLGECTRNGEVDSFRLTIYDCDMGSAGIVFDPTPAIPEHCNFNPFVFDVEGVLQRNLTEKVGLRVKEVFGELEEEMRVEAVQGHHRVIMGTPLYEMEAFSIAEVIGIIDRVYEINRLQEL